MNYVVCVVRVWFCIFPTQTTNVSSDCDFTHIIIYELCGVCRESVVLYFFPPTTTNVSSDCDFTHIIIYELCGVCRESVVLYSIKSLKI